MLSFIVLGAEGGSNSFILPHDFNEVLWGTSAFLIVMSLIIWKGGPAIKNMWNGRIERIEKELTDAQLARRDAESALTEVDNRIANADQERARIRAEADQTAAALKTQIVERAQTDAADLRRRVVVDSDASKAQATADLQAEVAALAIGAAEVVVTRNLDPNTQRDLIEAYIAEVQSTPGVQN